MDRDEYQVIWTRSAVRSLASIRTYISADRPDAAERVVSAIIDRVQQLAVVPEAGIAYPRGSDGRVREVLSGKYRVFYRIDETRKTVEILDVRHGARRDPSALNW